MTTFTTPNLGQPIVAYKSSGSLLFMKPAIELDFFAGGFIHLSKAGTTVHTWQGLESLTISREDGYGFAAKFYKGQMWLKTFNGQKFELNNYYRKTAKEFARLSEVLPGLTIGILLDHCFQELNQRGAVHFGGLTVTPGGLQSQTKQLAWHQLSRLSIGPGWTTGSNELYIFGLKPENGKEYRFGSFGLAKIPNIYPLVALIWRLAPQVNVEGLKFKDGSRLAL